MSIGFISGKKEFNTSYTTTYSTSSSFTTSFNTSATTSFTTTFNTAAPVYENQAANTSSWMISTNYGTNEMQWNGTYYIKNYNANQVTHGIYTYYRSNQVWFNSTSGTFYYLTQRSYQGNRSTSRTTSRTTTFSTSRTTTTSFNTSNSTNRTTSFYQ